MAAVDKVVQQFLGEEGMIIKEAEFEVQDFLAEVGKIDPKSAEAFEKLESVSIKKINQYTKLAETVQNQVVDEFDKELVVLSDKGSIPFESLKPDFTEETFEEIKRTTESKATKDIEEKKTFGKSKKYSIYVQEWHFSRIKENILERLDNIKYDLIDTLVDFVENIRTRYINELAENANAKKAELDAIYEAKITAEQNLEIIKSFSEQAEWLKDAKAAVKRIEGGILKNVQ